MNVFVAGGTGLLGRAITAALLGAGHQVTVGSRSRPTSNPLNVGTTWVRADVTAPSGLAEALRGSDAVVDAVQFPDSPIENPKKGFTFERVDLGGTKNLVDAAKEAGVSRFIGISGANAAEAAPYHWLRFKWQEEQYIAASGVPYTILRPSWVFGPADVSLNRFLGFAKFLPFVPVIGDGKVRISSLFIGDLAAHVVAAVERDDLRGRTFDIGGPRALTMDEIVRAALKASGKRRFLLHQPTWLMKPLASVLQHAPGRPLTPDAIEFITMDGAVDVEPLRAAFGLPLTEIDAALKTYL